MLSGAWTDFQNLWGVFKAVLETKRCFQLTFMSSLLPKESQVSVCEFRQAERKRLCLRTFGKSFEGWTSMGGSISLTMSTTSL